MNSVDSANIGGWKWHGVGIGCLRKQQERKEILGGQVCEKKKDAGWKKRSYFSRRWDYGFYL